MVSYALTAPFAMPLAIPLAMPFSMPLAMQLAIPLAMPLAMPYDMPSGMPSGMPLAMPLAMTLLWRKKKTKIVLPKEWPTLLCLDQNKHYILYEIDPHIFHSISLDISYVLAKFLAMTIL